MGDAAQFIREHGNVAGIALDYYASQIDTGDEMGVTRGATQWARRAADELAQLLGRG
jgi:hypothetical protein